jgi:hypothetical protein
MLEKFTGTLTVTKMHTEYECPCYKKRKMLHDIQVEFYLFDGSKKPMILQQ